MAEMAMAMATVMAKAMATAFLASVDITAAAIRPSPLALQFMLGRFEAGGRTNG
jgi:hypothetical protein